MDHTYHRRNHTSQTNNHIIPSNQRDPRHPKFPNLIQGVPKHHINPNNPTIEKSQKYLTHQRSLKNQKYPSSQR